MLETFVKFQYYACCTAYICHNGPTAGSGTLEVDNGDINILERHGGEDERLLRNIRHLIAVSW